MANPAPHATSRSSVPGAMRTLVKIARITAIA
jgi:hypothetical protein